MLPTNAPGVSGGFNGNRKQNRRGSRDAGVGVVCGTLLAAGLTLAGYGKVAGIHAGLLGALLNAAVAVLGSLRARR